jgi:hypothetical protein
VNAAAVARDEPPPPAGAHPLLGRLGDGKFTRPPDTHGRKTSVA